MRAIAKEHFVFVAMECQFLARVCFDGHCGDTFFLMIDIQIFIVKVESTGITEIRHDDVDSDGSRTRNNEFISI